MMDNKTNLNQPETANQPSKPLLCENIISRIIDGKRSKIKVYPQYVTRASEVGHPCSRYLTYCITNWQDRTPYDPELQFIFEGGNLVEELALQDFEDAGFMVYRPEPDKAMAEMRPAISGHLDFRVNFGNNRTRTVEVKGLSKFDWDKLNCLQDFFNSKKMYIRKYPAQLMMYMYFKAEEEGYFYLKSIPGFQPKLIEIKLDYDYVESLLKKTEEIEKHVKNKTLPDRIDDIEICENCGFFHLCLPEIKRQPMEMIDDVELENMLKRWNEIKPISKEYEELDKEIKKLIEGHERLLIGNFLITGQLINRAAYIPKPVEASNYWKYKIVKVEQ